MPIWKDLVSSRGVVCLCLVCNQNCVLNGLQFLGIGVDIIEVQMVFTRFKIVRVITINVRTVSSCWLSHFVEVSALRRLSVCTALVMVTFTCYDRTHLKNTAESVTFLLWFLSGHKNN